MTKAAKHPISDRKWTSPEVPAKATSAPTGKQPRTEKPIKHHNSGGRKPNFPPKAA